MRIVVHCWPQLPSVSMLLKHFTYWYQVSAKEPSYGIRNLSCPVRRPNATWKLVSVFCVQENCHGIISVRLHNRPACFIYFLSFLRKIDSFILCCYAENSIANLKCESEDRNEFSSCDDMMKYPVVRACLWILGILAFGGNLCVLIWRAVKRDSNRVQSILLSNLAMADFLMGLYLLIIAVNDTMWKGEYFKHDVSWRNGFTCKLLGVLSMVSSEVSVAMLTVTTADRLICVVFALKFERLTVKSAYIICLCAWIVGIIISILPAVGIEYFNDPSTAYGFYGNSAMCLPFQLSRQKPAGWEYALVFFIILNLCSFVFILVAYVAIYWTIAKLVGASASGHMQTESARVNRLFFIVLTDFCCWVPVIVLGILSLTGSFTDESGLVYVWVAVFVLPLNSSVNPILYTLSTSYAKEKFRAIWSAGLSIWRPKSGNILQYTLTSEYQKMKRIHWNLSADEPPIFVENFHPDWGFSREIQGGGPTTITNTTEFYFSKLLLCSNEKNARNILCGVCYIRLAWVSFFWAGTQVTSNR